MQPLASLYNLKLDLHKTAVIYIFIDKILPFTFRRKRQNQRITLFHTTAINALIDKKTALH